MAVALHVVPRCHGEDLKKAVKAKARTLKIRTGKDGERDPKAHGIWRRGYTDAHTAARAKKKSRQANGVRPFPGVEMFVAKLAGKTERRLR